VHSIPTSDRTMVVQVAADRDIAPRIAGILIQEANITHPMLQYVKHMTDDIIICRCEHVTAGEIRELIRKGYRDINEIKTVTRAGMVPVVVKPAHRSFSAFSRRKGFLTTK